MNAMLAASRMAAHVGDAATQADAAAKLATMKAARLRQGFALFVILLGLFLLNDNLPKLLY